MFDGLIVALVESATSATSATISTTSATPATAPAASTTSTADRDVGFLVVLDVLIDGFVGRVLVALLKAAAATAATAAEAAAATAATAAATIAPTAAASTATVAAATAMSTALAPLLRTRSATLSPLFPRLGGATTTQARAANLIPRPKRPYLLDQIVILSDGSSYKQLTTSPRGVIRLTKDVRNNPMWNPSMKELADVEEDEAGRLKRFRGRFGMGFETSEEAVEGEEAVVSEMEALLTGKTEGEKK